MKFTILGAPTTKKNHGNVSDIGARCQRCRRGVRSIVNPSDQFQAWEAIAAPQLRRQWAARGSSEPSEGHPGGDVCCAKCDGSGKKNGTCLGCGGTGQRPHPFARPVSVRAIFYRARDVGDLDGFLAALADGLQTAGVLANDRQIKSYDGSRLLKDAERPRIELELDLFTDEGAAPQKELPL